MIFNAKLKKKKKKIYKNDYDRTGSFLFAGQKRPKKKSAGQCPAADPYLQH